MTWSIYKDSSLPIEQWEESHCAWFIDKDMLTNHYPNRIKFFSDGQHTINFDGHSCTIEVKDSLFVQPSTQKEILKMVWKAGYWGDYIEGFYRVSGKYYVIIGS